MSKHSKTGLRAKNHKDLLKTLGFSFYACSHGTHMARHQDAARQNALAPGTEFHQTAHDHTETTTVQTHKYQKARKT